MAGRHGLQATPRISHPPLTRSPRSPLSPWKTDQDPMTPSLSYQKGKGHAVKSAEESGVGLVTPNQQQGLGVFKVEGGATEAMRP